MVSIDDFLNRHLNTFIFIPGYQTAECVAPFWKFNQEYKKEKYSADGAVNLWTQNGVAYNWDTYDRVQGETVYGDWLIWSGTSGAYPNGGWGHVAMWLRDSRPGFGVFASQNPGAFREVELSLDGVLGALRAKELDHSKPLKNATLSGDAFVRTGPGTEYPLAPGYPEPLAAGEIIAYTGLVNGTPPWENATGVWVETKNGFFIWSGNVSL